MRTTVTLDSDVERLLKAAMRKNEASFKQVLNDAVRAGLGARAQARRVAYRQPLFDLGRALVDLDKAGALAAELEDRAQVAKMAAGR